MRSERKYSQRKLARSVKGNKNNRRENVENFSPSSTSDSNVDRSPLSIRTFPRAYGRGHPAINKTRSVQQDYHVI